MCVARARSCVRTRKHVTLALVIGSTKDPLSVAYDVCFNTRTYTQCRYALHPGPLGGDGVREHLNYNLQQIVRAAPPPSSGNGAEGEADGTAAEPAAPPAVFDQLPLCPIYGQAFTYHYAMKLEDLQHHVQAFQVCTVLCGSICARGRGKGVRVRGLRYVRCDCVFVVKRVLFA